MGFFDPPEKPNYAVSLLFHILMFAEVEVKIPIDGVWRMSGQVVEWIGFYGIMVDCKVCTPGTGRDP